VQPWSSTTTVSQHFFLVSLSLIFIMQVHRR
jgi:hypothetical protein